MNSSVGSLSGAHAEEGWKVCCLPSKNSTNVDRTLSVGQSVDDSVENNREKAIGLLGVGDDPNREDRHDFVAADREVDVDTKADVEAVEERNRRLLDEAETAAAHMARQPRRVCAFVMRCERSRGRCGNRLDCCCHRRSCL